MRTTPHPACEKRTYSTFKKARRTKDYCLSRQAKTGRLALRIYFCEWCSGYHLTSEA